MTHFSAIDIGRTGIGFARYWMDVVAHNIANVNTVTNPDDDPFRAKYVVAQANTDQFADTGSGVHVEELVEDPSDAPMMFAPDHPLANDEGYIAGAVVDLAGQLTDLMIAQRTYQANVKTIQTAKEAYEQALALGKG